MSRRLLVLSIITILAVTLGSSPVSAISSRTLVAPTGQASGDIFGVSVASAGDVNGDGFADLIVGAPFNNAGGTGAGRAYVYYGGPAADAVADLTFTGEAAGDNFGWSVASAGDVNGDGFDDLIVGAPGNDAGGADAGRAYVHYGGPAADATADLILTGAAAGDNFGFSVASAGDVNGDGFDDLIVGAPFNNAGGTAAGRAYVYYGGPAADAAADLTFTGEAAGDNFGWSVASAGDVNGDGFADLIVGAPFNNAGGVDAGRAYVYYGGPAVDAVADLTFTGAAVVDYLGYSVASAGDANGDGFDDLIVGAVGNDTGGAEAGRAYVYYGGPAADATADLILTGAAADDNFGKSVAPAGDVNGDGFADLIVGAPFNNAGGVDAGRAYVYYGGPAVDAVADLTFTGAAVVDYLGYSVASAGDVNGDGFDDLIVGAPFNNAGGVDAGRAYVFEVYPYQVLSPNGGEQWVAGNPATVRWRGHDVADLAVSYDGGSSWSTLAVGVGSEDENSYTLTAPLVPTEGAKIRLSYTGQAVSRSSSDASDGVFRIVLPEVAPAAASRLQLTPTGSAGSDNLGYAVASAGDVNGDGFADLIAGAPYNDAGGADAGRAHVYYGGPAADAVADLTLTGAAAGDIFGWSVASAGDVNGDGYDDVLVGAPLNNAGGADAGSAYVYYGGPAPDAVADLTLTGAATGDNFGWSVASAGDVNGDGFDDLVAGAPYSSAGGFYAGSAYVYYGGPAPDAVADLTLTGAAPIDELGWSVASAGDVNGDGFDDLAIGAIFNDAGGTDAGRAYVYYGGPAPDAAADLILTGAAAGDSFGWSVASAGDMDGDGFADLVVGARFNDAGGTNAGRAYVYSGGPGADAVADLTFTGVAAVDYFGSSVAPAGDVNGDGFDDLVIGASDNSAGGLEAGRVYVYYGGPGADAITDLTFTGASASDHLGSSVASAGDVNGDGFADLIVGIPYNDAGGTNAGRAYLFDMNRYHVTAPAEGDTWDVGATKTVSWLGAEPADLWLSTDEGASFDLLAGNVGGAETNTLPLEVPNAPTRFAKVKVTPADPALTGAGESPGVFRIVSTETPAAVAAKQKIAANGAAVADSLGYSVASAGDMNGDGFADMIAGARRNDAAGADAGRAYVYYGGPGADAVADLTLTGEAVGDLFGSTVSSAGDMNGDGFADVIVGAFGNDAAGSNAGRAYVYLGAVSPDATADLTLNGAAANDQFGRWVCGVGDVNGDGYADVVVGAPFNSAGGASAGRAYVYYGGATLNATVDLTLTGTAAGEFFGIVACGAGDVNADGYGDLLVGAYGNDAGGTDAGRAYLFYGGSVPDATADLTLTGAAAGDLFGISVSGAGDVNGDGFDDLAVGAYGSDAGGADAGRAYVFLAGPGLDATADLTLTGVAAGDNFGIAVAGADLNADGYSDVIVGAYKNDAGGADAGRVYVCYGSASPDAVPDLVLTGGAAGDNFGFPVAGGGDMFGDGFPELLAAATGQDAGGTGAGRAYAYDVNRFHVTSPAAGATWNVGAMKGVTWLGAEPADVWLSVDGGASYDLLESEAGGAETNTIALRVPHRPTKYARVQVTPSAAALAGAARSDSLFTIQSSVTLLSLAASRDAGGTTLSWSSDPAVGPEGIRGYRLYRIAPSAEASASGAAADDGVRIGDELIAETHYTDAAGARGSIYRLSAVNGLDEELELGRVTTGEVIRDMKVWPSPVAIGPIQIAFAAPVGTLGYPASDLDVAVFDVSGRRVATIARGQLVAAGGIVTLTWNGRDAAGTPTSPGAYFVRAAAPSVKFSVERKILIVR